MGAPPSRSAVNNNKKKTEGANITNIQQGTASHNNNKPPNESSNLKTTSADSEAYSSATNSNNNAANKSSSITMQQSQSGSDSSELSTYLSLIQQHLAVFMVDNATFLAERCAAEYGSANAEARYLLALCYYRGGSPERARQVLDDTNTASAATTIAASSGSSISSSNTATTATIKQQMKYLMAQCSYDMKDYSRAEDALLGDVRLQYAKVAPREPPASAANSLNNAMDEWIVQTTPCPIPNGAAGLALLGKICRKSNRKDRAIRYFRMSLQLDPFLWTSFVALAELGDNDISPESVFGVQHNCGGMFGSGVGNSSNSHNNPGWLQNQQNMQPNVGDHYALHQKPVGVLQQQQQQQQHHGGAAAGGVGGTTATTPMPPSFLATPMAESAAAAMPKHHQQQQQAPQPQFDRYHPAQPPPPQQQPQPPASASTSFAPAFGPTTSSVHAPNAPPPPINAGPPRNRYVMLQTPGLTPIPMDHRNNSSMMSTASANFSFHLPPGTQQQQPLDGGGIGGAAANASSALFATPPPYPLPHDNSFHQQPLFGQPPPTMPPPPASAVLGAALFSASSATSAVGRTMITSPQYPAVLKRARDVASRQYYPPSPETAAGTPVTNLSRSMRYLGGLGTATSAATAPGTTTTATPATAAGVGGGSTTAKKTNAENRSDNAGGEGRSLFAASAGTSNDDARTSTNAAAGIAGRSSALASSSNPPAQASSSSSSATENDHNNNKDVEPVVDGGDKVNGILQLLSLMGAAYQQLCKYQCRHALELLRALPARQQNTGWVLHQQGRAFLELNDFANSQRCLELLQQVDPGRVQGLELLSTVYWHLKKETELAYLSQRVVDMDRLSPEAWCVVGNCFSLQKDHESALVFFQRSLQLDPDFTYTHTLSGYEYMANESFDKATACFRQALRIDERHYNAWYGLGAIYHRQEKFDLAEYHFERAVCINPSSSVLRCNLGIAQHANAKSYQALDTLAGAFQLDPRNPQARFQRATIYSSLHRHEEALEELRKVRDAAPREATIHFAMGKVLKRLGKPGEAMKCFMTALDLDPKDNQMIKSAMDKLDEPEIDEETMEGF